MPSKTIRFPEDLASAIEAAAKEQDRSFSYLVVKTCAERFLFKSNPYSVSDRGARQAEERALEKALANETGGVDEGESRPEYNSPPRGSASPRAPEAQAVKAIADATVPQVTYACPKATCPHVQSEPGKCPWHRNLTLKPS